MSATAIMRALLVNSPAVQAAGITAPKVFVGIVPQATQMPAVYLREISAPEDSTVSRRLGYTLIRSRVQVTVYAKTFEQMKAILKATKLGAGVHTGVIAGYAVASVINQGTNTEFPPEDDGIYEQSRDFMVTFREAN